MTFDQALLRKFEAGRQAHPDSPWDAEHVNARQELQDELLDAFNYSTLLNDEVLATRVQLWCRDIWTELQNLE
jgi:hypothetical protein